MKTADLKGAALDWAVVKCEGWKVSVDEFLKSQISSSKFAYSSVWAKGGQIIEREGLTVEYLHDTRWLARHPVAKRHSHHITGEGPTPLIAAMRCHVASKLGDDVEIPENLK